MAGSTLIEPELWQDIRKKVYLPQDIDEYSTTSRSLTVISQEAFVKLCHNKKEKPLKIGYMVDLCRDGGITPCALMLGLLYLQRISVLNPKYLTKVPSSDIFLTAMVIASKYLQDEGEMEALVNSEWAKIGQRSKSILDNLERDFLQAIDWRLYVSPQEYYNFVASVQGRISCMEAGSRGWWSYTDLISLWDASNTTELMIDAGKHTTKTMGSSLAAYLVCLTALLSASHNVSMETKPAVALDNSSWSGNVQPIQHHWCTDTSPELEYTRHLPLISDPFTCSYCGQNLTMNDSGPAFMTMNSKYGTNIRKNNHFHLRKFHLNNKCNPPDSRGDPLNNWGRTLSIFPQYFVHNYICSFYE